MSKFWTNLVFKLAIYNFRSKRGEFYSDLAESMHVQKGVALSTLLKRYGDRYTDDSKGILSRYWLNRLSETGYFYKAVRDTLPIEDIGVIQVTETAGELSVGLANLGKNVTALADCQKQITKTLAAAAAVVLLLHLFIYVEAFHILPKMVGALKHTIDFNRVKGLSSAYIDAAELIRSWWWLWVCFWTAVVAWITFAIPSYTGKYRRWLDNHIFVFELQREYRGAVFISTLSLTTRKLGSQVKELKTALSEARDAAQLPWLRWHADQIIKRQAAAPNSKAKIFDTGIVNQEIYYRMVDISDNREVDTMLNEIGEIILKKTPVRLQSRAQAIRYKFIAVCLSLMIAMYGLNIFVVNDLTNEVRVQAAR